MRSHQTDEAPHRQRGLDQREIAILEDGNLCSGALVRMHRVV